MHVRGSIFLALVFCFGSLGAYAGQKDRGIVSLDAASVPFVQKGDKMLGGGFEWARRQTVDYSVAVIDDINFHNYGFTLSPSFLYGIGRDLAAGITVSYNRSMLDLRSADLEVEGVTIDVKDYYSLAHKFGVFAFARKYLCIGNSGRVALYVDAGLKFSVGQSRITDLQGEAVVGTYETSRSFGLGVRPGVAAYMTRHLVLAAGIGIGSVDWSLSSQVHNQVGNGGRSGLSISYSIDLFALSVGLFYAF